MAQQHKHKLLGHHFRWVVIAATAAVIIVGIAFVILLLRWPFTQARIAQSLGESVSGSVTFTKFRVTYVPFPGCVAENVAFRRWSSPADVPPLATIQRIAIQTRYADLFLRPGYIARIVLNGLYVRIPPRGTGTKPIQNPNSSTKMRVGEIDANGATLEIGRRGDNPPLKFEIHLLTVKSVSATTALHYRATLTNALPPGEIVSTGSFGPWSSNDAAQTPLSGTATFRDANLGAFSGVAGTLSSDQDFQGTLGRIEVRGKADIPHFRLTKTDNQEPLASQFRLIVDAMNGDVLLQQVDALLVRTKIIAHGSIAGRAGQKGKTTFLNFAIDRGRIQDVLRLFSTENHPSMDGVANFRAQITVPPLGQPFLREVMADADFQIDEGTFEKPSTQANVNTLSQRARGEKIDTKNPSSENAIASLKGHAVLHDGTAHFTEVSFSVPGADARMSGTFDLLNDRMNFHGKLKTEVKFSQTLGGGIKSVLLKPLDPLFKKKSTGAVIPVYMIGTYGHPHFGIDLLGDHDEKHNQDHQGEKTKSPHDSSGDSIF